MLTTDEPTESRYWCEKDWLQELERTTRIFLQYARMFAHEMQNEKRAPEIIASTAPAFLHYFNTGNLATVQQMRERIIAVITPFDSAVKTRCGFSASEAVQIADFISDSLQKQLDETSQTIRAARVIWERARDEQWDEGRVVKEVANNPWLRGVFDLIDAAFVISEERLGERFGTEVTDAYLRFFGSKRGSYEYTYLTDPNPAEERPLIYVADRRVALPGASNPLYLATYERLFDLLKDSDRSIALLKRRDEALEKKMVAAIERLQKGAVLLVNAYETPDNQFEHDLIVISGRSCLVIEAKATPPVQPFRDPSKAYRRIKQAFQNKSIQVAYDQAKRISDRLLEKGEVALFNDARDVTYTLRTNDLDEHYCVCVTADSYGVLSTDLTLFLEKPHDHAYPWVVNILDLETLIDGFEYVGWGIERLFDFIRERIQLHGKVYTEDELEIAGVFLRYGTLGELIAAPGRVRLSPEESYIFDQIYIEKQGGEKAEIEPEGPLVFKTLTPVEAKQEKGTGRNDPCPCGSGKKFKRCCGR